MRLLLDTHVLLWALSGDPSLHQDIELSIADPSNTVFVSAASLWEIAIKRALGKLVAPTNLVEEIGLAGFDELAVSFRHADAAGSLPPHHRDPFDRMLESGPESPGWGER